ncbi:MAG: GerMN domain-containing protein [Firmicutes bacterium]|nr:GerMN domain-containing protein [Bacillota bacterium]
MTLLVTVWGTTVPRMPTRTALANSVPLEAVGRSVVPKHSTSVRMVEEEVNVDIHYAPALKATERAASPDYPPPYVARVHAVFLFESSRDERLTVGFPPGVLPDEEFFTRQVEEFRVTLDGEGLAHRIETIRRPRTEETWAVWETPFRKGRIRMDVAYTIPMDPPKPDSDLRFYYVLRTGKYWEGPIGKALIRLKVVNSQGPVPIRRGDVLAGTTRGWRVNGSALVWEYTNIEPQFDMEVHLRHFPMERDVERALTLAAVSNVLPPDWLDEECSPEELARLAYSVKRHFGLLYYEARSRDADEERLIPMFEAGVFVHRRALLGLPDDDDLHSSYLGFLAGVIETDKRADLLEDWFRGMLRALERGKRADLSDFGDPAEASSYRRAVRMYAHTADPAKRSVVVNVLKACMVPPRAFRTIVNWSGDLSGLPAETLEKAQRDLYDDLRSGGPDGGGALVYFIEKDTAEPVAEIWDIPATPEALVKALLGVPRDTRNLYSPFISGIELKSATVRGRTLTLDFNERFLEGITGRLSFNDKWVAFVLERTLSQIDSIDSYRVTVNGRAVPAGSHFDFNGPLDLRPWRERSDTGAGTSDGGGG